MSNIAIDWSKYMQGLQGKANIALDNISGSKDIAIEYKVNSDGSWYRKYKSGWLEQGGIVKVSNTVVTLLKPFNNTNYTLLGQCNNLTVATYNDGQVFFSDKTTSSFKTSAYRSPIASWYACGQGA